MTTLRARREDEPVHESLESIQAQASVDTQPTDFDTAESIDLPGAARPQEGDCRTIR